MYVPPTPSLTFTQCQCGIEYKILLENDPKSEGYVCACNRTLIFQGRVFSLWVAVRREPEAIEWVPVPISRVHGLD
jgi:hypothetical protein